MQDRPRDEGMRGNRSFGTGVGIDIGIGILQGLTRPPAGQNPPANDTGASHKTDAKTTKRAGKKDKTVPPLAPKQQTTDKPPPTPPVVTTPPPAPPPSTVVTSPPPDAPPPAKVENPPTNTPSPPQPVTPLDQATTKTDDVCPQRGRGCLALLVNFRKYAYTNGLSDSPEPDELDEVAEALDRIKCQVDSVAPDIKSTRSWQRPYYIGLFGHGYHGTSDHQPEEGAAEHNAAEMAKIDAAVARHRQLVKALQPETVIEMVSAHGHGADLGLTDTFGFWSPHREWQKNHISRGKFHGGNYDAVNHNACDWFVYDSSCFSGLTARAIDTLNNTGHAAYTAEVGDSCAKHAAYEVDAAVGTATDNTCAYTDVGPGLLAESVLPALALIATPEKLRPAPKLPKLPLSTLFSIVGHWPSRYSDTGYRYCAVLDRQGYGFSTPVPPPP